MAVTWYRERRLMVEAGAKLKTGVRYWLNRNPGRKAFGLSAGWGEVELTESQPGVACPYVRDCTDGDVYPVDPRDLKRELPRK